MLSVLAVLLSSCGHDSPLQRPTEGPQVPPLPGEARQPVKPELCQPTCSSALSTELESWLKQLTPPESQGKPASPRTKD